MDDESRASIMRQLIAMAILLFTARMLDLKKGSVIISYHNSILLYLSMHDVMKVMYVNQALLT